jgi:RNA polymerase sigma-70 factor (ECF subfamily)
MALLEFFRSKAGQMAASVAAPDATAALIQAAQQGNHAAFMQLYQQHKGRVYALCRRMLPDDSHAQDALQDAFLRMWQQLPQFRGDCQFATWVHRIATGAAIDHFRRLVPSLRAVVPLNTTTADESGHDDALTQLVDAEHHHHDGDYTLQHTLDRLVARLPAQARAVFVLVAVEGYSHSEVAQWLSIAEGSSKAHYHRARELLQEWLDEA